MLEGSTILIYSPFAVVFVICNGTSGVCVPNPTLPVVSTVMALILLALIENGCADVVPISGVAVGFVITVLTLFTFKLPDISKLSVGVSVAIPTFPVVSTVTPLILLALIENGCADVVPISGVAVVFAITVLTLLTLKLPDTSKLSVGVSVPIPTSPPFGCNNKL